MLVVEKLEVFELVVKDRRRLALDVQRRVGQGRAAQLQRHLLVVVAVNVAVATGPDEVADCQAALLRHHVREQRIAGDVEGHTQKNISTALVQLATELAGLAGHIRRRNVKLEKGVAGRQRLERGRPVQDGADALPRLFPVLRGAV